MFNLDISRHTSIVMMTAILHKKIFTFLDSKGRKELFGFIKSIKISQNNLMIKTEKPIINSELKLYTEDFRGMFIEVNGKNLGTQNDIKIIFR